MKNTVRVGILFTVWLVFVWFAVFGEFSWVSLVGALLVALAAQWFFPLPHQKGIWHFRLFPTIWLVIRFIWDMVRAGVHVAQLVITGKKHDDAIIECPIRTNNHVDISVLVAMVSLVPGTIVLEIDLPNKVLYLHCLDTEFQGGTEGIKRMVLSQEARILRAVASDEILSEADVPLRIPRRDHG